mmetsp:Transcript_23163/g.50356  ORF Transcript_23163/g.50356 Transcript_23163/m.50356 type:complete len:279 (+) Transcript_23163:158-994(+)
MCCCCPPAIEALFCLWVKSGCSKSAVAGALTFFPPDPPLYKFHRISKDGNELPEFEDDVLIDDDDDSDDDDSDDESILDQSDLEYESGTTDDRKRYRNMRSRSSSGRDDTSTIRTEEQEKRNKKKKKKKKSTGNNKSKSKKDEEGEEKNNGFDVTRYGEGSRDHLSEDDDDDSDDDDDDDDNRADASTVAAIPVPKTKVLKCRNAVRFMDGGIKKGLMCSSPDFTSNASRYCRHRAVNVDGLVWDICCDECKEVKDAVCNSASSSVATARLNSFLGCT